MIRALALVGLVTLLTACGTADGEPTLSTTYDAPHAAPSGSVVPGTFKLYTTPDKRPDPACDIHTALTLVNGTVAPVAILATQVEGICEIALSGAPRVYDLVEQHDDLAGCGSKLYTGATTLDDGTAASIVIVDHRERVCRDLVEAKIIVTETSDARIVKLFSTAHRTQP